MDRRRFALALPALALSGLGAGCATMHPEVRSLGDLDDDSVMLVGRIELQPALRPEEQDLRMSSLGDWDPMGAKKQIENRAILYLAERADAPRAPTRSVANPPLEQVFFVRVPRRDRYLAHAMVFLKHRVRVTSAKTADVDTAELWLPLRLEFDIRPGDRAIYVGTWRAQRDEFNEVTSMQILDQYGPALAEMRKRFSGEIALRRALPTWRDARARSG
jgi:hypothetical protein